MPAVTIRDVPDHVRDELAARAARAGQSLQEYLQGLLLQTVEREPVGDVIARIRRRVEASESAVPRSVIIRARDADRR